MTWTMPCLKAEGDRCGWTRTSGKGRGRPAPLVDQILAGKKIWNVAALALTYRLHDIGMLSDWHYRTTCIEL